MLPAVFKGETAAPPGPKISAAAAADFRVEALAPSPRGRGRGCGAGRGGRGKVGGTQEERVLSEWDVVAAAVRHCGSSSGSESVMPKE